MGHLNRVFSLVTGLILTAIITPQSVYACSCMYMEDDHERFASYYDHADVIFQGIPTEVGISGQGNTHYRVSVEKVWKGHANARIDIQTAADSAACGIDLPLDTRVLIFASEYEGVLHTNLCSGTVEVSQAQDIIDWLNDYDEDDIDLPIDPEEIDCSPYVCENGQTHPRCEEGYVIKYLIDPCQFSTEEEEEYEEESLPEDIDDLFTDVTEVHPNFPAISFVRSEGIVSGYENGTYLPDEPINRAEFTKIIIEANFTRQAIDACDEELPFSDVNPDDWFFAYVCMAYKYEVLDGYPDGTFRPANLVNFAEASKIVINAFAIDIDPGFEEGAWWRKFVLTLAGIGGLPSTFTDPNQSLTRGDMAEIIFRVMMSLRNG